MPVLTITEDGVVEQSLSEYFAEAKRKAEGFENHQWKLCDDGVECKQRDYLILKDDLVRFYKDGFDGFDRWLVHMSHKDWVDLNALREALNHARAKFQD